MPSSVTHLIRKADCLYGGSARWGAPLTESQGGIYLIATDGDPEADNPFAEVSLDRRAIAQLIEARMDLTVDGLRPSVDDLAERLTNMWLPDEPVVYIGKATTLNRRVSQYYSTPAGARSPHSGGWPLKLLANLEQLWVHWAISPMPELAEQKALAAFVEGVSLATRRSLVDPNHPYPFANLEGPGGRKGHRIRGARAPKAPSTKQLLAKDLTKTFEDDTDLEKPGLSYRSAGSEDAGVNIRPTLHDEILSILISKGDGWMTTAEIARAIKERGIYLKRDGTSDVTPFQVHGRTKNYPLLFEKDGQRVRRPR